MINLAKSSGWKSIREQILELMDSFGFYCASDDVGYSVMLFAYPPPRPRDSMDYGAIHELGVFECFGCGTMNGHSFVYVLINDNRVQYVGSTSDLGTRLAQHWSREQIPFDSVMRVIVQTNSRYRLENMLISLYQPPHNKSMAPYVRDCT